MCSCQKKLGRPLSDFKPEFINIWSKSGLQLPIVRNHLTHFCGGALLSVTVDACLRRLDKVARTRSPVRTIPKYQASFPSLGFGSCSCIVAAVACNSYRLNRAAICVRYHRMPPPYPDNGKSEMPDADPFDIKWRFVVIQIRYSGHIDLFFQLRVELVHWQRIGNVNSREQATEHRWRTIPRNSLLVDGTRTTC